MEIMAMIPGKDFAYYHSTASLTLGDTIYDKTNVVETTLHFQYLQSVGYIRGYQDGAVELTEEGKKALRDATLQNLSMNAYKNYVDIKLKFLTITISLLSLMISTISIVIACLK